VAEIRIVTVSLTGVLHDLFKSEIESRPDMVIVEKLLNHENLSSTLRQARANVILWGLDDLEVPEIEPDLFENFPDLKVLAIHDDGRRLVFWELRPQRMPLGEMSLSAAVELIRHALKPARDPGRHAWSAGSPHWPKEN
jgi:hypothetical protein